METIGQKGDDLPENYAHLYELLASAEVPEEYIDSRLLKFLSEFIEREQLKDKLDPILDSALLVLITKYPFIDSFGTHDIQQVLSRLARTEIGNTIVKEHTLNPVSDNYNSLEKNAARRLVELAGMLTQSLREDWGVRAYDQDHFVISPTHVMDFLDFIKSLPTIEERAQECLANYVTARATLEERFGPDSILL